MKLYKLEASNYDSFFGIPKEKGGEHIEEKDVTFIAQTPSCDAFLLLSNTTYNELELLDTAPSGFDFTYCQEWGLEVNDAKIDRVIADLS